LEWTGIKAAIVRLMRAHQETVMLGTRTSYSHKLVCIYSSLSTSITSSMNISSIQLKEFI